MTWERAPVSFQTWAPTQTQYPLFSIETARIVYLRSRALTFWMCLQDMRFFEDPDNCTFPEKDNFDIHRLVEQKQLVGQSRVCTALILTNLASPHWITVRCGHHLLPHMVCVTSRRATEIQIPTRKRLVCDPHQIQHKQSCFEFHKYLISHVNVSILNSVCLLLNKKAKITARNNVSQEMFEILFIATSLLKMKFIVLNGHTKSLDIQIVSSAGIRKDPDVRQNSSPAGGFLSCSSNPFPARKHFESIYHCPNDQYVSVAYLLDGEDDCFDKVNMTRNSDETCQVFSDDYWRICPNWPSKIEMKLQRYHLSKHVVAGNSRKASFVNGLWKRKQKKVKSYDRLPGLHVQNFFQIAQFNCEKQNTEYFSFSDICKYLVDDYQNLTPCKSGSHIQECSQFECNVEYKCPGYYCVPQHYVCNGRWDCPHGFDENTNACIGTRVCEQMFKCRDSPVCISLFDVCNDVNDCPANDDEFLCQLFKPKCLAGCECFQLAIRCVGLSLLDSNLKHLPYISSNVSFCSFHFLFLFNDKTIFGIFPHNSLQEVCFSKHKANAVFLLDLSFNNITSLSKHCFRNLANVKIFLLQSNQIKVLEQETFFNISSPFALNLDNNTLNVFPKNVFLKVCKITILRIKFNPLLHLEMNLLSQVVVDFVETDHFKICLIVPAEVKCHEVRPWYVLLPRILSNRIVATIYISFSVCILGVNLASGIWHLHAFCSATDTEQKGKAIRIILFVLSLTNVVICVYFKVVWSADKYLGETLVVKEKSWTSSFSCELAHFAFLYYSVLSPLLYLFKALSGFHVTKHPLDSSFKSHKFVLKCLISFQASALIFSAIATSLWTIIGSLPTPLCLPFVDPLRQYLQVYVADALVFLLQTGVFLPP